MKNSTKILSIILAVIMAVTSLSAVTFSAYAASVPKTSISKLEAKSAGFKVTVKKASKVTGYQIQYSTSSKMKSAKTAKTTKTSKTISGLKGSKKYYVRVRSYKTSGKKTKYSSWSKKKSVTTKKASTSGAVKITECKGISSGFKVVWNPVSNDFKYYSNHDVKYQIQYSKYKNFKSAKTKTVECNENEFYSFYNVYFDNKGTDISSGTYYVRMRAVIDKKNKAWSDTKKVNVENLYKDLDNMRSGKKYIY